MADAHGLLRGFDGRGRVQQDAAAEQKDTGAADNMRWDMALVE